MRYIKPPKKLTNAICPIKASITSWSKYSLASECSTRPSEASIRDYISQNGASEYILDVRIFRSALISELLNLNYEG